MQLVGGATAGSVGLAVVYLASLQAAGGQEYISSTAAGLSLVYALSFTEYLTWLGKLGLNVPRDCHNLTRIVTPGINWV